MSRPSRADHYKGLHCDCKDYRNNDVSATFVLNSRIANALL